MTGRRRNIIILDTTLRDGDQSPGFSLGYDEKLVIAGHLENMGVNIIEAGFPASSEGQFHAVRAVAQSVKKTAVSAMARAVPSDIKAAGEALRGAVCGYIHVTVPVSPVHRNAKLGRERDEILSMAVDAVHMASGFADFVEIGAEDAARTEPAFLLEFCHAVTSAGASVVNITDTVGYAQPQEFYTLVHELYKGVRAFRKGKARLSVHCHNDMGFALANTLAGLSAGASQAEVTLLGIGERGGNTAIEELAAVLKTRSDYYSNMAVSVDMEPFADAARDLSLFTGIPAAPCKPVAGRNAFTHGSGIHQHGMVSSPKTYSVLSPEDFGYPPRRFILTRHSGSAGINAMIRELTADSICTEYDMDVLRDFKELADSESEVSPTDFLTMLAEDGLVQGNLWYLSSCSYERGDAFRNSYSVMVEITSIQGELKKSSAQGTSLWEAVISVMNQLFSLDLKIRDFSFSGTGAGYRFSGILYMAAEYEGVVYQDESRGEDLPVLFARSYLNIINRISVKYRLTCL